MEGNRQRTRDLDIKTPTSWKVHYLVKKKDMKTNNCNIIYNGIIEICTMGSGDLTEKLILLEVAGDDWVGGG